MAAEESSQGAALGPDFSETPRGSSSLRPDLPDLYDVLAEYRQAQCCIEMVSRVLHELMEDAPEEVCSCAVALHQGLQMLEAAYLRLDQGLITYRRPGGDPDVLEDPDDEESDEGAEEDGDRPSSGREGQDSEEGRLRTRLDHIAASVLELGHLLREYAHARGAH